MLFFARPLGGESTLEIKLSYSIDSVMKPNCIFFVGHVLNTDTFSLRYSRSISQNFFRLCGGMVDYSSDYIVSLIVSVLDSERTKIFMWNSTSLSE